MNMNPIAREDIRIGDWVTREYWVAEGRRGYWSDAIRGYRVIKIDDEKIYVLSNHKDMIIGYKERDGWVLTKRDWEWRRIVL